MAKQAINIKAYLETSARMIFITLLKAYRFMISPWMRSSCRFDPSCSLYALDAIKIHGCLKGGYYAMRRLMRCHPWHPGGIDPIP